MGDVFVFTMITKARPWRHIYHDIDIPRPKNHDIEIPRPKNRDIEIPRPKSHDIEFLWNSDMPPDIIEGSYELMVGSSFRYFTNLILSFGGSRDYA